jgi:DNA-binding response OmpR family regulator
MEIIGAFASGLLQRATAAGEETRMGTVLIVEDSPAMQRTLRRLFEADLLEVQVAGDGPAGLQSFREATPGAVVLDLKLPGISGKELCREFKSMASNVPIVVLSANSDTKDKVLLLELGADDYVTKPFSPKELLARVRRAMRRSTAQGAAQPPLNGQANEKAHDVLSFGEATVNFSSMEATNGGAAVTLTVQEFKLLKFLASSPGRVFSRDELLNQVWGYNNYPSSRTVDNHVLRLRQSLEPDPANPRFLLTVHGAGYKMVLDAPRARKEVIRNSSAL